MLLDYRHKNASAKWPASKTGLLRLWCFGTNEADVVAQWAVEV